VSLTEILAQHGLALGRRIFHRYEILRPDGSVATTGNARDVWHWLHREGLHTLQPATLASIEGGWCGCGCRDSVPRP
jgi:hypothetical protein